MKRQAVFALVIATSLPACSSQPSHPKVSGTTRVTMVSTTTDRPRRACTEIIVREVVESFVAAYNSGQEFLTRRFFADGDKWQWYSDAPGRVSNLQNGQTSDPYDRLSLDEYFDSQRARGDHIEILSFIYNGSRDIDNSASFAMTLRRPNGLSSGKAAIDCSSILFTAWSTGEPK